MQISDLRQNFTPNDIARKIGGDPSDALYLLHLCVPKGDYAAIEWANHGDHTKPWPLSDVAKRADTLVDIRIERLCADIHKLAIQHIDDGLKSSRLQLLKKFLMTVQPFDGRKFHRDEIARWFHALGVESEFKFGPEPTGAPVVAVEPASDGPAPLPAVPNWKMRVQAEATELFIRLLASGANPTPHSILDSMVTWCHDNEIKTDGKNGGINPSKGYLRTWVLGGRHWTPPTMSREQAKKHVAQVAQAKVAQVAH